jgi:hypothetical protein
MGVTDDMINGHAVPPNPSVFSGFSPYFFPLGILNLQNSEKS